MLDKNPLITHILSDFAGATMAGISTISEAIEDIRYGRMIILVNDRVKENDGDLCIAAEKITADTLNFMTIYGGGLICVAMSHDLIERLRLPMMTGRNNSHYQTAFTVSVDAKEQITTGISAYDRVQTIRTLLRDDCTLDDLVMPGHIFPLKARRGGVLKRAGQTEGSVDLCRLAGMKPAAVICSVMRNDGSMARLPELIELGAKHNLKVVTISDLIDYRLQKELLVKQVGSCMVETEFGEFKLIVYEDELTNGAHIALINGTPDISKPVLVRIHSECLTGDVFHSLRCDCGPQLYYSMKMISENRSGILLYLRQEGRGIGLKNKIVAYGLQDSGLDTVEANVKLGFQPDMRDFGIGAQILLHLGINKIRLLTNNPQKINGLARYGLVVIERIPLEVSPHKTTIPYLKAKKDKLGHILSKV